MDAKKILFYFCGEPVYEGSEEEKHHKKVVEEHDGDFVKAAKKDIKEINKILKTAKPKNPPSDQNDQSRYYEQCIK